MAAEPSLAPASLADPGTFLRAASQGRAQRLWRVDTTDQRGRLVAHGELRLQNVTGK